MGASSSTEEAESVCGSDGHTPRLYLDVGREKWPLVYSSKYNISFLGLERVHPFDSGKWSKVRDFLLAAEMVKEEDFIEPLEASAADLRVTHTDRYLTSLGYSYNVAMVVEVPPVAFLPNSIVQRRMLQPFRFQTGGTVLAGKLALDRGWSINIGGGFHHCSSDMGGGFCAYADITLSIKFLFQHVEGVSKVMIIDLDAHQGNGHERDFMDDSRVYIMDMYNRWIYPNDRDAKAAIKKKVELDVHCTDEPYLSLLESNLTSALTEFSPDLVVYNAGTDVLLGDPLGAMDITSEGVVKRDEIVFNEVRRRKIPIFMVTSGGYQRSNARVIADSILNLKSKSLITGPDDSDDPRLSDLLSSPEGQPPNKDAPSDFLPPLLTEREGMSEGSDPVVGAAAAGD